MTKAYQLLGILQSYAPTGKEQYEVSKWYNRLRETIQTDLFCDTALEIEAEIEKALINILADGVNHGNWPWIETPKISSFDKTANDYAENPH